jgi:serine/threonine protein kinase
MNTENSITFLIENLPNHVKFESTISDEKTLILKVKNNSKDCAMKIYSNQDDISISLFQNETMILKSLKHPNILELIEASECTHSKPELSNSYIMSPYCQNGTLYDLLIRRIHFTEKELRTYFHQLVDAIEYMHSQKVFHMDLKPCNVMVGDNYELMVFDFDLSIKKGESKFNTYGTQCYRAPELIFRKKSLNHEKCDVYSLGVVLFTMHNGCNEPFREENSKFDEFRSKFDHNPEKFWEAKQRFFAKYKKQVEWSVEFKELFENMVQRFPEDRWSIKKIKESSWFNGEVWTKEDMKEIMAKKYEESKSN